MTGTADAAEDRLALYVEAPTSRVGGRLRTLMQQRGYQMLKGEAPPPDGFALRVTAVGRAGAWLHPDPPDAFPDGTAKLLSEALRARVTTVLRAGGITAYEVCAGGRVVEKLAAHGAQLLEEQESRHAAAVEGGASLEELLTADGLAQGFAPFDADHGGRTVVLVFGLAGKKAGETIEIDPLVTCPECGEASVLRQGRFGEFYSCVRFPDCRGRRTLAEAKRLRAGG